MLVRPVDLNGMIQNANGFSTEKVREDAKPELTQSAMAAEEAAVERTTTTTVHTNQETAREELNPDREGNGSGYAPDEEQEKKKHPARTKSAGRIIKKGDPVPFDVRI